MAGQKKLPEGSKVTRTSASREFNEGMDAEINRSLKPRSIKFGKPVPEPKASPKRVVSGAHAQEIVEKSKEEADSTDGKWLGQNGFESFPEYLKRVADDQEGYGRIATAEDYRIASERLTACINAIKVLTQSKRGARYLSVVDPKGVKQALDAIEFAEEGRICNADTNYKPGDVKYTARIRSASTSGKNTTEIHEAEWVTAGHAITLSNGQVNVTLDKLPLDGTVILDLKEGV